MKATGSGRKLLLMHSSERSRHGEKLESHHGTLQNLLCMRDNVTTDDAIRSCCEQRCQQLALDRSNYARSTQRSFSNTSQKKLDDQRDPQSRTSIHTLLLNVTLTSSPLLICISIRTRRLSPSQPWISAWCSFLIFRCCVYWCTCRNNVEVDGRGWDGLVKAWSAVIGGARVGVVKENLAKSGTTTKTDSSSSGSLAFSNFVVRMDESEVSQRLFRRLSVFFSVTLWFVGPLSFPAAGFEFSLSVLPPRRKLDAMFPVPLGEARCQHASQSPEEGGRVADAATDGMYVRRSEFLRALRREYVPGETDIDVTGKLLWTLPGKLISIGCLRGHATNITKQV